jgi:hypothetical protein
VAPTAYGPGWPAKDRALRPTAPTGPAAPAVPPPGPACVHCPSSISVPSRATVCTVGLGKHAPGGPAHGPGATHLRNAASSACVVAARFSSCAHAAACRPTAPIACAVQPVSAHERIGTHGLCTYIDIAVQETHVERCIQLERLLKVPHALAQQRRRSCTRTTSARPRPPQLQRPQAGVAVVERILAERQQMDPPNARTCSRGVTPWPTGVAPHAVHCKRVVGVFNVPLPPLVLRQRQIDGFPLSWPRAQGRSSGPVIARGTPQRPLPRQSSPLPSAGKSARLSAMSSRPAPAPAPRPADPSSP